MRQALEEIVAQGRDKRNSGNSIHVSVNSTEEPSTLPISFATHTTYEELISKIKPFEATGGLHHDIGFLQRPDTANFCREILSAIA